MSEQNYFSLCLLLRSDNLYLRLLAMGVPLEKNPKTFETFLILLYSLALLKTSEFEIWIRKKMLRVSSSPGHGEF